MSSGYAPGRYFVVRGRLLRMSDPALDPELRETLVTQLMDARRAMAVAKRAKDRDAEDAAHPAVDCVKHALGERGKVWWDDGAPDFNRHIAGNTHYAQWFSGLSQPAVVRACQVRSLATVA